ncbi:DNA polymerase zeta catalytic subunit [Cyanidiococcus yangmingshanensis]|uniref:DNA polymerase n=1 Tax=Cyanidiococcus yangmingshanensis TaxID=2690220 RepID=A0A7J7INB5_9RHOD|nr:DNA polymerase zeta catalytic subunit [Cyanidiococcus yangmingshanensis]
MPGFLQICIRWTQTIRMQDSISEVMDSDMERQVPSLRLIWESERRRRALPSLRQMWVPIAHCQLQRMPNRMDEGVEERLREVLWCALRDKPNNREPMRAMPGTDAQQRAASRQSGDLSAALAALFGSVSEALPSSSSRSDLCLDDDVLWNWLECNYREQMERMKDKPALALEPPAYPLDERLDDDGADAVDEEATQREYADIMDCSLAPDEAADDEPKPLQSEVVTPRPELSTTQHPNQGVATPNVTACRPGATQRHEMRIPSFQLKPDVPRSTSWFLMPDSRPPCCADPGWRVHHPSPFYSDKEDQVLQSERNGPRFVPAVPRWQFFWKAANRAVLNQTMSSNDGWLTPMALPPLPQNLERAWRMLYRCGSHSKTRKVVEIHVDSYGREVRTLVTLEASDGIPQKGHSEGPEDVTTNQPLRVSDEMEKRDSLSTVRPPEMNRTDEAVALASATVLLEEAPTSISKPSPISSGTLDTFCKNQIVRDGLEILSRDRPRDHSCRNASLIVSSESETVDYGKNLTLESSTDIRAMSRNISLNNKAATNANAAEMSSMTSLEHASVLVAEKNGTRTTDPTAFSTDRAINDVHGKSSIATFEHASVLVAEKNGTRTTDPPTLSASADANTTIIALTNTQHAPAPAEGICADDYDSSFVSIADNPNVSRPLRTSTMESLPVMVNAGQRPRTLSGETTTDSLADAAELDEDERGFRPASPRYDEPSEFWGDVPHAARSRNAGGMSIMTPRLEKKGRYSDVLDPSQISSGRDSTGTGAELTPLQPVGLHGSATESVRVLAIESFSITRREQRPDPFQDPLAAIALSFRDGAHQSQHMLLVNASLRQRATDNSLMLVREPRTIPEIGFMVAPTRVVSVASEEALLNELAMLVRTFDPDILVSYSLRQGGVAYLLQRAAVLQNALAVGLSRIASSSYDEQTRQKLSISLPSWELHTASGGIRLLGRYVLDVWRIMQSEVKLHAYTFHHVVEEILGRRMPQLPWSTQRDWFANGSIAACRRVLEHLLQRAVWTLDLLEALDVVGRTAEMATSYGIDFLSVLLRGSQYRVESLMARLAHAHKYVLVSPTAEQVRWQRATAFIPLVMEPEARYYSDPVLVLDFQSLYPSMIIAHNVCFSTCLGRVLVESERDWRAFGAGTGRMLGVMKQYQPDWQGVIEAAAGALGSDASSIPVDELLSILPNQTVFVKPRVRQGILPRMLREILETRMMLKRGMEAIESERKAPQCPDHERLRLQAIYRMLNSRQFAMKYIANVTYGYTSASFSGRMPCAEIADAIVSAGRQAMEQIVAYVEATWGASHGARVVYGDTDSIFVHLPAVSREQAFQLGRAMAEQCTALFPDPVRLKLEKVYSRSLLLAKKRYVGWAFESETQRVGILDAKGIETVRRDSCGLVQKILERALRLLFTGNNDLSPIKRYVQRQLQRVMQGRFAFRDAIFFKEVQLGRYRPGHEPPAALVALQQIQNDPEAVPAYRERVPYVVVYGEPGSALRELVIHPQDYLNRRRQGRGRLNALYYVRKQILPALDRCFALMGVDVSAWFYHLPRIRDRASYAAVGQRARHPRSRIEHFLPGKCIVCGRSCRSQTWLCSACRSADTDSLLVIQCKLHGAQQRRFRLQELCHRCIGEGLDAPRGVEFLEPSTDSLPWYPPCEQIECSLLVERDKVTTSLVTYVQALQQLQHDK